MRTRTKSSLLLTDLIMPGNMNGRELAETLWTERPGLKVIFTSGYSADIVGKDFKIESDLNFLQKPYHPQTLALTVRRCLDGKEVKLMMGGSIDCHGFCRLHSSTLIMIFIFQFPSSIRYPRAMIIAPSLLAADYPALWQGSRTRLQIRRRLAAPRHHGRPFRAEHFLRPGHRRRRPPADKNLFLTCISCVPSRKSCSSRLPNAGADQITIHVELGEQVEPLIWKIKKLGKKVGLAVNPPTAITAVQPHLEQIDMLLVMTVNPGFGGQAFIHECLPKIQQAEAWRRERKLPYRIEVDGGINNQTAAECARAGADTFVAGTSLFGRRNLKAAVAKMRKIVNANDPALADLKV